MPNPNTPAGTPNAVEEVLARIKGVKHNIGPGPRTYYLAEQSDLDDLIAAVRAEEREKADREITALGEPLTHASTLVAADERRTTRSSTLREVRVMVEEVTGCCGSCRDVGEKVLAGLAKMEGK